MGRILGIDPGDVRHGIAISDPTGTIATPHSYVDSGPGAGEAIAKLCSEYQIEAVIVGLPLRMDGTEGPAAVRSRSVGEAVAGTSGVPVDYWDERFTTVTAEAVLLEGNVRRAKRKTKRDQIAAAVMLQGYLDRQAHDDRHGQSD